MTQKNAPLRIALRRSGRVSLKRPAAGGESCKQDFFFFSQEELTRISRQVTRTFDLNNPVDSVYSDLNKFRIFIVIQLYIYLIKDANALLIYYLTIILKKVIYK